jgi:hypothetical protein
VEEGIDALGKLSSYFGWGYYHLYRDFLLAPQQQDLAVTIGLRPADPKVALHDPISLAYGTDPRISPENVPPLAAVDGETRAAIIDLFKQKVGQ